MVDTVIGHHVSAGGPSRLLYEPRCGGHGQEAFHAPLKYDLYSHCLARTDRRQLLGAYGGPVGDPCWQRHSLQNIRAAEKR